MEITAKFFKRIIIGISAFMLISAYMQISSACGISAEAAGTDLVADVTPCENGCGGKIEIILTGHSSSDTYYLSTDGGKNYTETDSRSISIDDLPEGYVSFCIKSSENGVSPVSVYYVPESGRKYPVMISAEVTPETVSKDASVKVHIENYDREKIYQISSDGGKHWKDTSKPNIELDGLSAGDIDISVRIKDTELVSPVLNAHIDPPSHGNKGYIDADDILQNPELPTGCEITSLTMLLNHIGFDAQKTDLADNYLPKGECGSADFNEVFVGNPRRFYSFGCFSRPIVKAAEKYLRKYDKNGEWLVRNITGCGLDSLFASVDRGDPPVVWASTNMAEIGEGRSWVSSETGKTLVWPLNEHCMLLTGYDIEKNIVYFNDPMIGKTFYSLSEFGSVFETLGRHAVIIVRKDEN